MNKFYQKKTSLFESIKPWVGSVIILPIIFYLLFNDGRIILIDYINLLIHEGGHGIFKPFGRFIHALGGTIAQISIPLMFVVFYLYKQKKFPAQLALLWLGQNLINVSIYVADARAQKLPLLGGKRVYHDWTYLLSEVNLLEYDKTIGAVIYTISVIVFIVALLVPIYKRKEIVNLELNL